MKKTLSAFLFLILAFTFVNIFTLTTETVSAQADIDEDVVVYMLGRDDCGFCKKQHEWLQEEDIRYEYLNIVTDEEAAQLFAAIAEKHDATKATPMTIIGERIIVGWNSPLTTGESIKAAIHVPPEEGPP